MLFSKQMLNNLSVTILSFCSSIVVGILLVPYLVENLGVAAYGLIPLAMFLTEYISIITQSITSSVNRFFTLKISEGDTEGAIEIFNTAFFIMLFSIIVISLLIVYPIFNLEYLIDLNGIIFDDVKVLFLCVFGNFFLSILASIFNVSLYSLNKMNVIQYVNVLRVMIRVLTIVILFDIDEPSLSYVGYGSLLSGITVFIVSYFLCFYYNPEIKISISRFNKKSVSNLLKFGSWVLVSQVGFILFAKVDLLFINLYMGTQSAGEFSIVSQLSTQLRTAFGVVLSILGPYVLIQYTKKDRKSFIKEINIIYLLSSYLIGCCISFAMVFSDVILSFWIGSEFVYLSPTLNILLFSVFLMVSPTILYSYLNSIGSVKLPALFTVFSGCINVSLTIFVLKYTEFGYLGVAIVSMICVLLRDYIFVYIFSCKKMSMSFFESLTNIISISFCFIIPFVVLQLVKNNASIMGFIELIILFIIYLLCCLFLFSLVSYKKLIYLKNK